MCQRLVDATPWGHWTTFVAGLRETGIIAPLVLDGPMTGKVFRADNEPEASLGLYVPQPAADRARQVRGRAVSFTPSRSGALP